jgi:hypothetical protein
MLSLPSTRFAYRKFNSIIYFHCLPAVVGAVVSAVVMLGYSASLHAADVDVHLNQENKAQGVTRAPQPATDELSYLRRIYVDLIGRIPTAEEIAKYEQSPSSRRREQLVEQLMADPRFTDRWTVFFEDMLRLRSQATGGAALIAYVHQAINDNLPYDEMCRRLLTANGKAGRTPEVGFILGDDADPKAMARITSQVFLGIRIGCAECHDHPFDVWKREDFYSVAAFFGKTRRVESQLTKVIYTTESEQSTVMWPPEGDPSTEPRKPMTPRYPFPMVDDNGSREVLLRLTRLREERARPQREKAAKGPSVDDLLSDADSKVKTRTGSGPANIDVNAEAKKEIRKIDIDGSLYARSELRAKLADQITSPKNRLFAQNIVNRVWKELIGRGFVEPIDDFRKDNPPSHPETLGYLADEFVASGYDFRWLVKTIVATDVYTRSRAPADTDEATRNELEVAFLATPMRRMISEAIYDSIVTAGHLFEFKHPAGANELVLEEKVRVPVVDDGKGGKRKVQPLLGGRPGGAGMAGMPGMMARPMDRTYAVEDAIELDFKKVLNENDEEVSVEKMEVMSREELEAARMLQEKMARGEGVEYVDQIVKKVVDANPKFNSSLRMESPAPPGHFLRVFGQPTRSDLGEQRDEGASMRQALVMLNGKLTHEASRVGPLEEAHNLLTGDKVDVEQAIRLAYLEIMTRKPSADELAEAREIIRAAANPVDGYADLRWVLLNCNEFRFLP